MVHVNCFCSTRADRRCIRRAFDVDVRIDRGGPESAHCAPTNTPATVRCPAREGCKRLAHVIVAWFIGPRRPVSPRHLRQERHLRETKIPYLVDSLAADCECDYICFGCSASDILCSKGLPRRRGHCRYLSPRVIS